MSSARLMTVGAFGGFSGISEIEENILSRGISSQVGYSATQYARGRKEAKLLRALHKQHGRKKGSEMYMEYFAVEAGVLNDILHNMSDLETRAQYKEEAKQIHEEVIALRKAIAPKENQHGR